MYLCFSFFLSFYIYKEDRSLTLILVTPGTSISTTLSMLENEELSLDDIPTIKVFRHDEEWWTCDNRRLWVLKEFCPFEPVQMDQVPCNAFRLGHIDNTNGGHSVKVNTTNWDHSTNRSRAPSHVEGFSSADVDVSSLLSLLARLSH